jgi:hypothetical protein
MIMMMIGLFSQRAWTTASSYEQNPLLGFKSSMFGIHVFSSQGLKGTQQVPLQNVIC